ncbi:MAG: MFS transporter, partial [Candidatus Delongbacteria bacterium]|nr:MFS transporter [Candidatus Delongbacteria bacterium]
VFFYAAGFLGLASLGIWAIKEFVPKNFSPIKYRFAAIFSELKQNKRLQYYLMGINTLGLGYGILPFVILYSDKYRNLSSNFVGTLLIAKTDGLIMAGLFLFFYAKRIRYHRMMQTMVMLGMIFPAIPWLFPHYLGSYIFCFFAGGLFLSLYHMIISGVLLEISNIHNRSIYTGIAGAGSILPVIFPLIGGTLINFAGFNVFFIIYTFFMLISIIFIHKLDCKK